MIDLGCQSAKFEMNFFNERHFFTHTTLVHKNFLSDDPACTSNSALNTARSSDPRLDDPAPVSGERLNLSVQVRMIRPLPG